MNAALLLVCMMAAPPVEAVRPVVFHSIPMEKIDDRTQFHIILDDSEHSKIIKSVLTGKRFEDRVTPSLMGDVMENHLMCSDTRGLISTFHIGCRELDEELNHIKKNFDFKISHYLDDPKYLILAEYPQYRVGKYEFYKKIDKRGLTSQVMFVKLLTYIHKLYYIDNSEKNHYASIYNEYVSYVSYVKTLAILRERNINFKVFMNKHVVERNPISEGFYLWWFYTDGPGENFIFNPIQKGPSDKVAYKPISGRPYSNIYIQETLNKIGLKEPKFKPFKLKPPWE